jgi:hypothetical protein
MVGPLASATLTAFAFALALALPRAAAGEPVPRVALAWRAPEGCGDAAGVRFDVERLVRGSPPGPRIEAEAEVTRDGDAVHVLLRTRSAGVDGERRVEAASCAQVASATAVILALMIDPNAAARAAAEDPPPRVEPPPQVTAPPPPPGPMHQPPPIDAVASRASPRRPVRFVASASAAGDAGTMPGASVGGAIAVASLLGPYRLGVRAGYFPHRSEVLGARPTAGGDFSLFDAGFDACRALVDHRRARAELCAGVEIDHLEGQGFGVTVPSAGAATFGVAALGGLLDLPLASHLSAELRAGATAPFARPAFYFDAIGTVHRPSPVGGRLSGGLAVHF